MAVAWFRNPVLDERADVIDRSSVNERTFGVTESRRHPAYVYSINKNACLMHKIQRVEIQWYAFLGSGELLGRLKQPAMIAHTVCGVSRALTPDRSRTCHVPLPDSIPCGRCHGEAATFGKHGSGTKAGLKRVEAAVKLGCAVAGYPSALTNNPIPRRPATGAQASDARRKEFDARGQPVTLPTERATAPTSLVERTR